MGDLANYVVRYYGHFMTDREKRAYAHLGVESKMSHMPGVSSMLQPSLSQDPEVLELAKDGEDTFVKRTAARILAMHEKEVYLNLCPQCNKIAKTPKARQCRFCFHDWHSLS